MFAVRVCVTWRIFVCNAASMWWMCTTHIHGGWHCRQLCVFLFVHHFRISGNAASDKNIHGTVSEQLKKTFAKSRWKVSARTHIHIYTQYTHARIFTLYTRCILYTHIYSFYILAHIHQKTYLRAYPFCFFNLVLFEKWKWRVKIVSHANPVLVVLLFQQAYHAATVIRQMQRMALNSSSSGSATRNPALSQSQLSTTQMTTSSSSLQCSSDSSTSGSNLPAPNSAVKKWKIE